MIKNFLDADLDDSPVEKEPLEKKPESEKEFEEFAAPFSEIEAQKTNAAELFDAQKNASAAGKVNENQAESDETKIVAPDDETINESFTATPHHSEIKNISEPKFDKAKEKQFWEKQLQSLKLESPKSEEPEEHDRREDLKTIGFSDEDFGDDDFETVIRPKNEPEKINPPQNKAPEDFESLPTPNDAKNFSPQTKENEETGFVLPRFETSQPFAASLDEIKNEAEKETPSDTNSVRRRDDATLFSQSQYHSETPDETIRKSGLAYTAAIVLTASIVFTLILGWFADLLLGTSPWGKVGGIILGAIIGFVQFFRTTSQIFKNKD